ncbi:MAG: MBL fold metallo-hydrolase [Anaerolineales bacterium]|nr:MBL fold metallo-hydrolase [Anaerolineales bacterium]
MAQYTHTCGGRSTNPDRYRRGYGRFLAARAGLSAHGYELSDIQRIIITHSHVDHLVWRSGLQQQATQRFCASPGPANRRGLARVARQAAVFRLRSASLSGRAGRPRRAQRQAVTVVRPLSKTRPAHRLSGGGNDAATGRR